LLVRELSPRFNTLLDQIPGMVYQCRNDLDHTLEYASKGCFALTGYLPEDLILSRVIPYGDLIDPDDREMVWINVQNALNQRKPFELVYRIHTRDKQVKWVRDLGSSSYFINGNQQLLEGFVTDITDWKLAEEKIQKQVRRFQALRAIDVAISAGPDLQFTLGILLEQILAQLNVDAAAILLHRMGTPILEYTASRGFHANTPLHTKAYIGRGFAGIAALTQKTIHIPDLSVSAGLGEQLIPIDAEQFKVYYGIPLIAKGQVKGVLEVFMRTPCSIDQDRLEFLEALGGQAAIAIDNSSLFEQLQDSNTELSIAYDATLEGWAKALEMRDRETIGHTHRVIEMTLAVADRIGIQGEMLQDIRRGALLHDIGKMGIPDSILLKPGPLTPLEWEVMRQHPVHAYEMLKSIEYLAQALEIPYSHHERWDGTGYPRGLKGRDIPISARIFAVVDVWDALTSDRPYRPAWSARNALEYIQRESGRHFDPQVVNAFMHQ
jgi:putative nucleotidyltransferase with HDIG domain/PAS domain S-box-containing protein